MIFPSSFHARTTHRIPRTQHQRNQSQVLDLTMKLSPKLNAEEEVASLMFRCLTQFPGNRHKNSWSGVGEPLQFLSWRQENPMQRSLIQEDWAYKVCVWLWVSIESVVASVTCIGDSEGDEVPLAHTSVWFAQGINNNSNNRVPGILVCQGTLLLHLLLPVIQQDGLRQQLILAERWRW